MSDKQHHKEELGPVCEGRPGLRCSSLKGSLGDLEHLIEGIQAGIVVHGANTEIKAVNSAALDILGLTAEQLLGKDVKDPCWHFIREDETRMSIDEFPVNIVSKTKAPLHDYCLGIIRQDREKPVWVLVNAIPQLDQDGNLMQIVVTSLDITKRKQAEHDLRRSERLLQEAQRVTHIGHWELDLASMTPIWSDEIFRIFGLDPNDAEPSFERHQEITHPDDWHFLNDAVTAAVEKGIPFDIRFRIVRPDKEVRWMHAMGHVTKDSCGNTKGVFGTAQDVTEQKEAEERLASRIEFEQLIGAISSEFVGLKLEDIDAGIDRGLSSIGGFAAADRAYVFQFRGDGKCVDNTHEWCADGIAPERDKLQGIELDKELPWLARRIRNLGVVNISDVNNLPPEAQLERDHFRAQNIQSLVVVPMAVENRVFGFLGFDAVRRSRAWNEDDMATLRLVGETFANALERKRVEKALRQSQERYMRLSENSPAVVYQFMMTPTGEFSFPYINETVLPTMGVSAKAVMADASELLGMIHRDDIEDFRKGVERSAETLSVYHEVIRCLKDGEVIWVECQATPEQWTDGGILWDGFFVDVSERRRAEETLRSERAQLFSIFDNIPCIIDIVDPKTHEILFMNEYARNLVGNETAGKKCYEVFHKFEFPCSFCNNEEILQEAGRPVFQWEYFSETLNCHFSTMNQLVNWPDGRRVKLEFSIDITDRKQAEAEKAKLESQLRQAQKMEAIGTLAGGIAHDFNNVLGIILGNLELAVDDVAEDNPARLSLSEARKGCLRARDMVRQILAFSRREEKTFQTVDIQPIVKEGLKMLRSSVPSTIEIRQDISTKQATVMGDPTQVHQVLMNLCSNAVDAMDGVGNVLSVSLDSVDLDAGAVKRVSELTPGPYIRLTVSDTGQGMAPKLLDKIFDPYFTTKEVGQGTGMGLAMVHGIVQEHSGAVSVSSEPGEGTTFHVYFPRAEHETDRREATAEAVPRGSESVLFVDDELPLANLGRRMLESLGYETESRTSSVEALEAFRADPDKYDLVITDMTMPDMTGEALAKEVMAVRPDVATILCTGFSNQMDQDKAKSMGIKGFVMKPLIKSQLAATIRKVLDGA